MTFDADEDAFHVDAAPVERSRRSSSDESVHYVECLASKWPLAEGLIITCHRLCDSRFQCRA